MPGFEAAHSGNWARAEVAAAPDTSVAAIIVLKPIASLLGIVRVSCGAFGLSKLVTIVLIERFRTEMADTTTTLFMEARDERLPCVSP